MTDNLIVWLFRTGTAVVAYGFISSSVRYVNSWRIGHRIMAAQAVLQTVLCLAGLLVLLVVYENYLQG